MDIEALAGSIPGWQRTSSSLDRLSRDTADAIAAAMQGQVLPPLLLGYTATEDLFRACTRCGACREVCPAGIDHPKMFQVFETRQQARKKIPGLNREEMISEMGFIVWGWLVTRPRLWEMAASLTRKALSLPALSAPLKKFNGPVKNRTHSRTLPHPASQTFREHWKALKKAEYD